jgi:cytochrome b pre-mRNA-processing protein 3
LPKTEDGEDLGIGGGWWHTGMKSLNPAWMLKLNISTNGFLELGLPPTFSTWSQVTMLYLYILFARLRCFPADAAQPWQQHLLDHFFGDAENRMIMNHNMQARGVRTRYLKDLFIQWRGLLAAYDEGLVKGDAVLAAAVWRNIFKANQDVDIRALAQIVAYTRRLSSHLDTISDEDFILGGLEFATNPSSEKELVSLRSKAFNLPAEKISASGVDGETNA